MSARLNPYRDWPAKGEARPEHLDQIAVLLADAAQILDVVKGEWAETGSWSDWDQGVRDRITATLRAISAIEAHFGRGGA